MKKTILILLSFAFLSSKCNRRKDDIPYVPINITININEPAFFNLTSVGGHETIVGGSLGIIIYRNGFDEFSAIERHVPYNVNENCQVAILDDEVTLDDPCSESQWLIIDGSILNGPTSKNLLQYDTSFNNPILRIFN